MFFLSYIKLYIYINGMKSSMYLQHPATSRILKFPLVGETTRISFVAVEQDHFAQKMRLVHLEQAR